MADFRRALREEPGIYGVEAAAYPGGEYKYLEAELGAEEVESWKRKHLPAKAVYTDADFTPEGKVAILRWRGYSDGQISSLWPYLSQALGCCSPGTSPQAPPSPPTAPPTAGSAPTSGPTGTAVCPATAPGTTAF